MDYRHYMLRVMSIFLALLVFVAFMYVKHGGRLEFDTFEKLAIITPYIFLILCIVIDVVYIAFDL